MVQLTYSIWKWKKACQPQGQWSIAGTGQTRRSAAETQDTALAPSPHHLPARVANSAVSSVMAALEPIVALRRLQYSAPRKFEPFRVHLIGSLAPIAGIPRRCGMDQLDKPILHLTIEALRENLRPAVGRQG